MRNKIKSWFIRYLPAEILGTLFAVVFSTLVFSISENSLLIAFVGTWSESVGFYGTMIVQEVIQNRKKYAAADKKYGFLAFAKSVRNIFLEFGLAETMDSLFIRPASMYFSLSVFGNLQLGILVGKFMADLIFYIPAIISFELRKRHLGD